MRKISSSAAFIIISCALTPALAALGQSKSGQESKKPNKQGSAASTAPTSSKLRLLGAKESGLAFTWRQFQAGEARLAIINDGDKDQKVTLKTNPLVLLSPSPDQPADTSVSMSLPSDPGQIPAHGVASFKLTGPPKSPKFTGHALYAGTIEIDDEASKESLLAPSIQISVPAPRSLLSKPVFIASRKLPFLSCDEQTGELPIANDAASDPAQRVVGYLQGNHDVVAVRWISTNPAGMDSSHPAAILQFDRLPHGGSYSGDIYLSDTQDTESKISVTVDSKDYVIWPLVVIALGIAAAWFAKRYLGVLRLTWGLRKLEAELGPAFEANQQKFATIAIGLPFATFSIANDLAGQRHTIRTNLDLLEKAFKWSIVEDPTYKKTATSIQQCQAWIAQWPTLATAAQALQEALGAATATIASNHMVPPNGYRGVPAVLKKAEQLISGKPLLCSEVPQRIKDLMDHTALIGTWQEANERVFAVSSEYLELLDAAQPGSNELAQLEPLRPKLVSVWTSLWWEVNPDAFAVGQNSILSEVFQVLETIKLPPKRTVYKGNLITLVNQTPAARHRAEIVKIGVANYTLSLPSGDKRRIEFLERLINRSDWTLIIFAFVIAVLTGLNANYLGEKPWGTVQDYIVLFLWAAGTKVGLDLISAVTDKFLSPSVD